MKMVPEYQLIASYSIVSTHCLHVNIYTYLAFNFFNFSLVGIVDGSLVQVLLGIYDYHTDGLTINYSYNKPEWNRKKTKI